jgi:hypothetical protein
MVKTEQIQNPQVYFDYLTSDEIIVLDVDLVSDETIETNVVVAAFTTAYARLKLYDVLDMLQERVLYYDTDSVIYVSRPNQPELPTGPYLGQLTDELGGDYITTFVLGGPKNYSYRTNTNKVETKVCGITLNCTAKQKVNFDVIHAMVYLHC